MVKIADKTSRLKNGPLWSNFSPFLSTQHQRWCFFAKVFIANAFLQNLWEGNLGGNQRRKIKNQTIYQTHSAKPCVMSALCTPIESTKKATIKGGIWV